MSGKGVRRIICLGALTFVPAFQAFGFDPLLAKRNIELVPSGRLLPQPNPCEFSNLGAPVTLTEAVERALCRSPKTRAAWARVKEQAAAVGEARSAFLPTLSGNWQGVRDESATTVSGMPQLGSKSNATVQSEAVTLNWVLFDFGSRTAALHNANALLAAARATQDATLQTEFDAVAKDYYAAQAAKGALDVAVDVERMTRESMIAAQARVDQGIAPITDALQAQTQHDEAVFDLAKAQGGVQTTIGALASDMGFDPSRQVTVPSVAQRQAPDIQFNESIERLITQVKASHPSVLAAEAQVDAARAKVEQARANGMPSVSLVGKYSRSNQPQSLGLGMSTFPATGHDSYIGVQVTIPLFEGFSAHYQVDQARAEQERQEDVLDDARRQVAVDVWNSYYSLLTATENVSNSEKTLRVSQRAFEAAQHRYNAGVGSVLELLNTQTALASARQRRVQALTDRDYLRLDFAAKLGRLDIGDVSDSYP